MKLSGKTAIITGGGSGIGRATAHLFTSEGANVVITGRRAHKLEEVQADSNSGPEIETFICDVASEEQCRAAVDFTINKFGKIDILFNNAGILQPGATHETDTETWDKIFSTNVRGTYLMSKQTLPHMLEQEYGVVVNNSSVAGLKAIPGYG